jgi:hypothetical protein
MAEEFDHGARVAAWLKPRSGSRSGPELLDLLDTALAEIGRTAANTLSEVTLLAVLERVAVHAREEFPAFEALDVDERGLTTARLRSLDPPPSRKDAADLTRYVLTEFLSVLGNLTAEILSPRLHAALSRVATPTPRRTRSEAKKK